MLRKPDIQLDVTPLPGDRCLVGKKTDCDGVAYPWRAVFYFCEGCRDVHDADLDEGGRKSPHWTWDGSRDRPTLNPSINPSINYVDRCHHFVRKGAIEYCTDSKHQFAGFTRPLLTIEEWPASVREYWRSIAWVV